MRVHKLLTATLLLCSSSILAESTDSPCKSWRELRGKNQHIGVSEECMERTLAACRKNKLDAVEAERLLAPVFAAHGEHLPTDGVFLKIEEGLAKNIPWKNVQAAADKRLACLRQASTLIEPVRQKRDGEHGCLIMHTCLALESGLPPEVLTAVFKRPGGYRYGRLMHVVEAGETLALEGLAAPDIKQVMMTCLERNLNRQEIFRAVDHIVAEHHAGKSFSTILSTLWVDTQ